MDPAAAAESTEEATQRAAHQIWVADVSDEEDDSSSESGDSERLSVTSAAAASEEPAAAVSNENEQAVDAMTAVEEQQPPDEETVVTRGEGSIVQAEEEDHETPLSRAMARAVMEFEAAAAAANDPSAHDSTMGASEGGSTVSIAHTAAAQSATLDVDSGASFGIEYRPFKQEKTYSVPEGPAFEDEEEFTKELAESALLSTHHEANVTPPKQQDNNEDADDEFDVVVGNAPLPTANLPSNPIEAVDPIALATTGQPEVITLISDEESQQQTTTALLEDQARSALEDITGIYASGLGDVGVRELDGTEAANTKIEALDIGKVSVIIEEGEEEEDEEEDSEEEQQHQHLEQQQLEAEWEQAIRLQQHSPLQDGEAKWPTGDDNDNDNDNGATTLQPSQQNVTETITYDDALQWIRQTDLTSHRDNIVIEEQAGFMQKMLISKLRFPGSAEELELPFLIACVLYDASVPQHKLVLETIYRKLTNSSGLVPDIGPHWEVIGFQGLDPATDLNRTMGLFALLQMLSFLEEDAALALELHRLSTVTDRPVSIGADSSWPFLCVSIGISVDAIQALRSGKLNQECNQRQQVLPIVHELHRAMFFRLHTLLCMSEVSHISLRLQQLRKEVQAKPLKLLNDYRSRGSNTVPTPEAPRPAEPAVENFTGLEEAKDQEQTDSSSGWLQQRKANRFRVR